MCLVVSFSDEKSFVAARVREILHESPNYISIWNEYAKREGDFLLRHARAVGEISYLPKFNQTSEGIALTLIDDGKFDLATAFETIYFWPGLAECFAEVRRVLKDYGHFLIVSESDGKDKPSMWFKKIIDGMNTYTSEEIEFALRSAGFRKIITEHHPKHSWLAIIAEK